MPEFPLPKKDRLSILNVKTTLVSLCESVPPTPAVNQAFYLQLDTSAEFIDSSFILTCSPVLAAVAKL